MLAVAKKRSLFSSKRTKKPRGISVTPAEHLLKQLALRYLVDQSMPLKDVAKQLKVTPKKIKSFFNNEEFVQELEERIERVHGIDPEFMQSQAKISLLHLYEEMRRREVSGKLRDLPTRELHKILVDTQKELRLDTPGAFTSKVGVADLGNLQDRYKKSLSGRMSRQKKKLKNVTPEKESFGKESSGVKESEESKSEGTR